MLGSVVKRNISHWKSYGHENLAHGLEKNRPIFSCLRHLKSYGNDNFAQSLYLYPF